MIRQTKAGHWIIDGDSHIGKWIEESGRLDHDQFLTPRFSSLIKPGGVALDVGALYGDHSIAYARVASRVIAIEPNPEAYECLARNMAEFKNVVPMHCALGHQKGEILMVNGLQNAGCAYAVAGVGVAMVRLDDLQLDRLDFVKLDVEGFEYKVLLGGLDTLRRCRPVIVTEINRGALERNHTNFRAIHNLILGDLGYCYSEFMPKVADPDQEPQFDAIYIP
jgi:FkbM family methyltransferase